MSRPFTIAQPMANLLDPYLTTDRPANLGIRFAIFEPLIIRASGSEFKPALATSWEVSPDARAWTFALRTGVAFHDGEHFIARHVAESLERVLDPNLAGELGTTGVIQSYLAGAKVSVVETHSIRIETPEPMADLLDILVELPISSGGTNGTGPFVVDSVAPGQVEMRAVTGYWGERPTYERVHWIAMPDADERVQALLAGEVDLISHLQPHHTAHLSGLPDFDVTTRLGSTCVAFLCNCFAGPCADARVRQALNLGLDLPALITAVADGEAEALNGPLTTDHFACDPDVQPYRFDPETAKQLLADAGYESGLEITLDVPETLPDEAPELARLMTEHWKAIGVKTTVRLHENREGYANAVRAKAIGDAACFDSSPLSSYRVLREKLHSGVAGPWWQGYRNPEVDALLDQATSTVDAAARQAIYRRAYRLIRDDTPWIFLYRPAVHWAARADARWRPSPVGWIEIG